MLVDFVELSVQHPYLLLCVVCQLLGEGIPQNIEDGDCLGDGLQLIDLINHILSYVYVFEAG